MAWLNVQSRDLWKRAGYIDRRQKGRGGDSSHAWYGHQAAAGRAFADHLKHHFVKDSALLPKGGARDEHGAHHRFKVRRLSCQLENAGFKWAGDDPTGELDPKCPRVPRISFSMSICLIRSVRRFVSSIRTT